MKKTLFATTLVLVLSLTAAAGQKKPAASQHLAGSSEETVLAPAGTPPGLCSPCLFYGGDLNVSDSNAAGLSDENTLLIPGSSTYAAFNVPSGVTAGVTGILVNVQADVNFDPQMAGWTSARAFRKVTGEPASLRAPTASWWRQRGGTSSD